MIGSWVRGLLLHRTGRLAATATGIALAVALVAALGSFLTASKSTMTERAVRSVAVDWQAEIQPGADTRAVVAAIRSDPGVRTSETVGMVRSTGLQTTTAGSTQNTGPGVVLGLPDGHLRAFSGTVRVLAGTGRGVLLAQQTAANLHAAPGDTVIVHMPGIAPVAVPVAGVVDLPQADSLFQKVGAPPQSQPSAPLRPTTSSSSRKAFSRG
ncbi:ABC transporter permease [Streptomyces sp. NPDC051578]|uniref:ABC transporter permease n=1 Tax=Streptomyces sp. NPDC051578 TaxID=3365662 RepID=UPI00378CC90F